MQQPASMRSTEARPPARREEIRGALFFLPAWLLAWLTAERAAYLGLALLGLALRLVNLGAYPLSDAEAQQALVAWRVYQGQPVDQLGYSPLMATLNLASFALFGANAFSARLGPALLGTALVLLPYGLRRHLGWRGALLAAALFAISPTTLYLSRTVNGGIGAAVGGLALVAGLFNWLDAARDGQESNTKHQIPSPSSPRDYASPRDDVSNIKSLPLRALGTRRALGTMYQISSLYLATAGLVLMLTASPATYSTLALLLGFLVLAAAVGERTYAASARAGLAALRGQVVSWGSFGLALVVGLVVIATTFLFNPGGLTAAADLLTTWLLGFAPVAAAQGAYPAIFLVTLYEPLTLLAGLVGLSASLLRRRLIDLFLGWWFFGSIALNLLRSGRANGEVMVCLVPLTLLAGLALSMLWDGLHREGSWQKEGILASTGLIISAYVAISLMTYTLTGGRAVWLPVAGVALYAVLVALFSVWYDPVSSLRGAALAGALVLALFAVGSGSRLNANYPGAADGGRLVADPRQPLAGVPAGEGLPDMVDTLKRISSWRAGDAYLVPVIADRRLGRAVEWSLRRFPNVTWVDALDAWPPLVPPDQEGAVPQADEFVVLLAPASVELASDQGYVGQDFAIRAAWSPAGLSGQSLVRWIVLREAPTLPEVERAVLWVEAPAPPPGEEPAEPETTPGESMR